jgi:hypothetical protein
MPRGGGQYWTGKTRMSRAGMEPENKIKKTKILVILLFRLKI